MRDNPYLKVLVQGGYYDAACDYFNATYTLEHLELGGEFKDRYRFARDESGHMMYLRRPTSRTRTTTCGSSSAGRWRA